jgi:hypothetical protein
VRTLLSSAVVAIGLASILIQLKSGQDQHLDLVLIDKLEAEVLVGRPDLLLRHSDFVKDHVEALAANLPERLRRNYLWRFRSRGRWVGLPVRISLTWAVMQTLVSVVGALAGILR